MNYRKLDDFLQESGTNSDRNRTVNIKDPVHNFYKTVSNHYDVSISTLVTNVLIAWKEKYGEEIKEKILADLKSKDL
jgi:hypothetical protein